MNLKNEVYQVLQQLEYENLNDLVIDSIDASKGDFCLPCFAMAKTLHKSPMLIADEIANKLNLENSNIEKVEKTLP